MELQKPVDEAQLSAYRSKTFRLKSRQLKTVDDAVEFVNERGFVYLWPIKGIMMPSLWAAVAGARAVSDKHDDPGHITWGWKDQMLGQRRWFYAKLLRGKATMVSLSLTPYFYALSENYGDPESDYLTLYEDGLLSRESKLIYEVFLREGSVDTVNLRRLAHMTSKASNSPFNRAMTSLQRDFKIVPVGISDAGAWRYSFIYDLVHRHYPDLPEAARQIKRSEARQTLVRHYFMAVGAATAGDVKKLFQWSTKEVAATLHKLSENEMLHVEPNIKPAKQRYIWPDVLAM